MNKKFYKNIVFSKTPLTTHFRHADEFQIYPCDFPLAPRSTHCFDFPLVIEYWVDTDQKIPMPKELEDSKIILTGTLQQNKLNATLRLLSAITNHRFFNYGGKEFKWGLSIPDKKLTEEEKKIFDAKPSETFWGIYTYPNMYEDLHIKEFSAQTHTNSTFSKHFLYYMNDPLDDRAKQISFPITISQILNKYFALDIKTKKVIDSVTHLICNGIDSKDKMKSLAFLSFVSAIEIIVNFEYKDKKDGIAFDCTDCQAIKTSPLSCPKCGRPVWGVKAKYKSFLQTYVSNSEESMQKFNKIYNMRSTIVHNGLLLLGDNELDWTQSEKTNAEFIALLNAMQTSRLSLVNWLCLGPNKTLDVK